jgi:solute carrier family 25 thiamine pyrophosphate transporter 19
MQTPVSGRIEAWKDLLSGAVAGCASRFVVAPLDVLKIRFQLQNEQSVRQAWGQPLVSASDRRYTGVLQALGRIVREEGWTALYKGNVPALAMVVPYAAVQFGTFYQMRQWWNLLFRAETGDVQRYMGTAASVVSGALSGLTASVVVYPLDLLRTRLAVQREPRLYNGLLDAIRTIWVKEGARGFYAGLEPTIVEIVPYVALQFYFYERLRHFRARQVIQQQAESGRFQSENEAVASAESLFIGAITGTAAKWCTLPLDNARKRMQVQSLLSSQRIYRNTLDCCQKIYRSEGVGGLFRGAVPSLLKAAPASGVAFFVYEWMKKQWLVPHHEVSARASAL